MLDNIESHKSNLSRAKDDTLKSNILIHLSWDYRVFDTDSALHYADRAVNLTKKIKHDSLSAKAMSIQASIYNSIMRIDTALIIQQKALQLRSELDYFGRIYSNTEIAKYHKNLGNFRLSKYYYEKCMKLFDSVLIQNDFNLESELFETLYEKGNFIDHKDFSDTDNSILKHISNNSNHKFNRLLAQFANIQLNLGELNLESGNPVSALSNFKNVSKIDRYLPESEIIKLDYLIYSYYGTAEAFNELKMEDSTEKYLDLSIRYSKLRPDSINLAKSYLLKGKIYHYQNQFENAIDNFSISYEILQRNKQSLANEAKILFLDAILDKGAYENNYIYNELNQLDDFIQVFTSKQHILYLNLLAKKDFIDGKYEKGMKHLNQLEDYKQKIEIQRIKDDMLELEILNNFEDLSINLDKKNKEVIDLKQTNIYIIIIMVLLFLVLILSLIFLFSIRKKNNHLKKLTEKKSQLFKIITHDIKTPLYLSNQTLKLLNDPLIDEKLKSDYLAQIEEAIERVTILVQSVLQWLFANDGSIESEFENYDVKEILEDVLYQYDPLINSKELSLELNLEDKIVYMDKFTFEIALNNIISNAIKFADKKSTISISMDQDKLCIQNTGVAFDKKQMEDFISTGKTYSKVGSAGESGHGLGLSIIRNLLVFNSFKFKIAGTANSTKTTINF